MQAAVAETHLVVTWAFVVVVVLFVFERPKLWLGHIFLLSHLEIPIITRQIQREVNPTRTMSAGYIVVWFEMSHLSRLPHSEILLCNENRDLKVPTSFGSPDFRPNERRLGLCWRDEKDWHRVSKVTGPKDIAARIWKWPTKTPLLCPTRTLCTQMTKSTTVVTVNKITCYS